MQNNLKAIQRDMDRFDTHNYVRLIYNWKVQEYMNGHVSMSTDKALAHRSHMS